MSCWPVLLAEKMVPVSRSMAAGPVAPSKTGPGVPLSAGPPSPICKTRSMPSMASPPVMNKSMVWFGEFSSSWCVPRLKIMAAWAKEAQPLTTTIAKIVGKGDQ